MTAHAVALAAATETLRGALVASGVLDVSQDRPPLSPALSDALAAALDTYVTVTHAQPATLAPDAPEDAGPAEHHHADADPDPVTESDARAAAVYLAGASGLPRFLTTKGPTKIMSAAGVVNAGDVSMAHQAARAQGVDAATARRLDLAKAVLTHFAATGS